MKGSSMKLNYVSTFSGKGRVVIFYQSGISNFIDYRKTSIRLRDLSKTPLIVRSQLL